MEPIEIKKLADDLVKVATEVKSELSTVKDAQRSSTEWNVKADKMIADMTAKSDTLQVALKALEEKAAAHEQLLARHDINGSEKKADELVTKSKEALQKYLRKGKDGLIGTEFKTDSDGALEIRGLSTDVNSDGGFLVLPEVANFMVKRMFETSPIRRLATVVRTQSKALEVPIDDSESGFTWVGEGADTVSSQTTPQVGKLTIYTHKGAAQPNMTTEMLEDPYVDIESWLQDKIADKFSRGQNTAYVAGTGVGQPRGFMTLPAWAVAGTYERGKIEQINIGAAVTADGLIDLQASLKEAYQGNASWVMKRATYGTVLKQKGADNYYFNTTFFKDGQQVLQLLGKPVTFADDIAAIGSNNLAVCYGDFAMGYTILDKVGLQILKDPYTSKGLITFYTTARTGGDVTSYDCLKIGKCA